MLRGFEKFIRVAQESVEGWRAGDFREPLGDEAERG